MLENLWRDVRHGTRQLLRAPAFSLAGLVALFGLAFGLAGMLAVGRVVEALLFDVDPRDPVVPGGTTLLLLSAALTACWLPARRASRISPVRALPAD